MRITSLLHAEDMPAITAKFGKTHWHKENGQIILDEQDECDCGALCGGVNTIVLEDTWPSVERWCKSNLIQGTANECGIDDDGNYTCTACE